MKCREIIFAMLISIFSGTSFEIIAQKALPDPLIFNNGQKSKQVRQWPARRKETLEMMSRELYRAMPGRPGGMHF